jgi:hypothetical protein
MRVRFKAPGKVCVRIELVKTTISQAHEIIEALSAIADYDAIENRRR